MQIYKGGYFTPSHVAAQQLKVDNFVDTLVADAAASNLDDGLRKQLAAFAMEWKKWLADHSSWTQRALNATAVELDDFEERARRWYGALKGMGVKIYAPALPGVELGLAFPWLSVAVIVGGLGLGLYIGSKLYPKGEKTVTFTRKRRGRA